MTTVIEHPAMCLTMRTEMKFDEFADHVWRANKRELRHRNDKLIELKPGLDYTFLMLGMKRLLNKKEFGIVYQKFMSEIKQLEEAGILPKDSVEIVATPLDVPTLPKIPDKFADKIEDGVKIKIYLTASDLSFTIAKEYPVETVEPEVSDGEIVIDAGIDGGAG